MIRIIIMLLLMSNVLCAQRPAALVKNGDEAMELADYYTAVHFYKQALEQKEGVDIRYRLAEAARKFKAYELAIEQYEIIQKSSAFSQFPNTLYGMGICYQALGDYAKAIEVLGQFLAGEKRHQTYVKAARSLLDDCKWVLEQEEDEEDENWTINRLPNRINSAYGEFGAYKNGDSLYYTSYRFELKDDRYHPTRKISKVMVTTNERQGRAMSRGFNEDTVHTAHVAITNDRQLLFFNRCKFTEGAQIHCQLCVRKKDRRRRWSKAFTVLPEPVNVANFTATQPTIMWDSLAQKEYLIFVSNRSGGSGQFDFWQVAIPENLRKWEQPIALQGINTKESDISPDFHNKNQRLYFSSQRSPGFGGYDLFSIPYLGNGEWGEAENLGSAINSSYDDTYPFVVEADKQLYFSSNRPGGRYLDRDSKSCCPDIFKATIVPSSVAVDSLIAQEEIPQATFIPEEDTPVFTPKTLEAFLPLQLFFDNDQPNPRTRKSTTRLAYSDTYFDYQDRETIYYDQFESDEDAQDEVAAFFKDEVDLGYDRLEQFSSILLEVLEEGQRVEIFLKGYTSPRAKGDYNLLLGKRRVSAVRNHFETWQEGVFMVYIDTDQLHITEVSFGETQAASSAKDEKSGERLSIYSPAAARERRVEIIEVKKE